MSAASSANAGMPAVDPFLMKRSRSRSMTAFRNVPLRRYTPPIASPCAPWQVTHFAAYTVAPYAMSALAYGLSCGGTGPCAKAPVKPIVQNTIPRITVAQALGIDRLSAPVPSHRRRIGVRISGGPTPGRRTRAGHEGEADSSGRASIAKEKPPARSLAQRAATRHARATGILLEVPLAGPI
jgi:hypothetical protein